VLKVATLPGMTPGSKTADDNAAITANKLASAPLGSNAAN
jgi:hypothetical protein